MSAPLVCVWMQAGVVAYKLCDRELDCDHCPFDSALRDGAHSQMQSPDANTTAPVTYLPAPAKARDANASSVCGYGVAGALFYHPGHVWARIEDEGRVRVGLDDFGQHLAGRIYSVWLPAEGTSISRGEACWRITHRAGESCLTSPVTGVLVQVNAKLAEQPSLINRNPYGEGWAMVIQPTRLEQCLRSLLYGDVAKRLFEQDALALHQRLDRLLISDAASVGVTMQDGGVRAENFMSVLAADQIRQLIDSFLSVPATLSAEAAGSSKGR